MAVNHTNPLNNYADILAGTNIKFKSGSQANLNALMTSGTAEEGVFYLTTDTHKLYIGRKAGSTPPAGKTAGKVYPEQVSRGVTVVDNTGELPSFPMDAPANAIEEGELYYVADQNILAALHKKSGGGYEWVQINPSTGVRSVSTTINGSSTATDKIVDLTLTPETGNAVTGKLHIKAGTNVQLASENTSNGTEGNITISATDTTYTLSTASNSSKGQVTLTDNASTPNTQTIDIVGSGTVKVTSTGSTGTGAKTVTVAGPSFTNIQAANAAEGFNITLNGKSGDNSDLSIGTGSTGGTKLNPTIKHNSNDSTGVKFVNGTATLNVYTQSETDTAISTAINNALQVADAMTFRGVVTSANGSSDTSSLIALVTANGAHKGDVYKVGSNTGGNIIIDGITADIGDLIIITGDETNGAVPYTDLASLLTKCSLIPSGDEPEVKALITQNSDGTGSTPAQFQLVDGKNNVNTNILTTKFQSGTNGNILLKGTETSSATGKILTITADHPQKDRADATNGDKTNVTLTENTGSTADTIGTNKYDLFVMQGPSGLKTDAYGHVLGLQGKVITFEHNRLSTVSTTYGSSAYTASGTLISATNNNLNSPVAKTQATATLTLTDSIGTTSTGALKFESDSLILSHTASGNTQLINIDLKWGTF